MELKEYIAILRQNSRLFGITVFVTVAISLVYFLVQPTTYGVSLTLNITRGGSQQVNAYKFDDFYRLQADEKFADTVVEWLRSPWLVTEIYRSADLELQDASLAQLRKVLRAEKRSAQTVEVGFSTGTREDAKKIAKAVSKVLAKQTAALNKDQREAAWFELVPQEAVIVKDSVNLVWVMLMSTAVGIFLAFWAALVAYYIK